MGARQGARVRRWLVLLALAVVATGCAIPTPNPTPPPASIQPRYNSIILHDWQRGGVQLGPKYDQDGIKVAAYWWQDCGPDYITGCTVREFKEFQTLQPNTTWKYAIVPAKTADDYDLYFIDDTGPHFLIRVHVVIPIQNWQYLEEETNN